VVEDIAALQSGQAVEAGNTTVRRWNRKRRVMKESKSKIYADILAQDKFSS
jgi:hypothetical protein